ncbi:phosphoribosyl-ATP diphosphatase [Alterisphingorhabdus coralli]|uniref:Phosphoribosyl-ATP pyrophosphatase n=1 Tax=Alterisphingorhabdus coralli TaxID=3071408 RepID=A0AA97F715_9SPHN|nr:phosphoribosyl-ATP diphosphatase [Parasphingorhabdus sp. SCSIO 66989]WOE74437.1 phosphoribosyl-ATP diphosphatase [Parasphingorhabdus sp. SCSIO 66989]
MPPMLEQLENLIRERQEAGDPDASYVARLLHNGREKVAQKVGEEAVETVIAAMQDDQQAIIAESADLLFHLLILLVETGVSLADIEQELARREGVSGLTEKASRKD